MHSNIWCVLTEPFLAAVKQTNTSERERESKRVLTEPFLAAVKRFLTGCGVEVKSDLTLECVSSSSDSSTPCPVIMAKPLSPE